MTSPTAAGSTLKVILLTRKTNSPRSIAQMLLNYDHFAAKKTVLCLQVNAMGIVAQLSNALLLFVTVVSTE